MSSFQGLVVVNRRGEREPLRMDKITQRNGELCAAVVENGTEVVPALNVPPHGIDVAGLALEVIFENKEAFRTGNLATEVIDLMTIDKLQTMWTCSAALECAELAGRVAMSCVQKTTPPTFSEFVRRQHIAAPQRITADFAAAVAAHGDALDAAIRPGRDFIFNLAGARTMIGAYLHSADPEVGTNATANDTDGGHRALYQYIRSKNGTRVLETPQYAYMRAAVGVYLDALGRRGAAALPAVLALYDSLSLQQGSLASPFIFNSGGARRRTASCILLAPADNLPSILYTELQAGLAASGAAGIGVGWTFPRAYGSPIASTGGYSTGLPSWIQGHAVKRDTVTQGSYRPGASAQYIDYRHPDFQTALQMAERSGPLAAVGKNAPRLMYAVVADGALFRMVDADADVVLIDPGNLAHPGIARLADSGLAVAERIAILADIQANPPPGSKTRRAREIYQQIYTTIRERGFPYVWFWDNASAQSNMSYMGAVLHSNLCAEITIKSVPARPELPRPALLGAAGDPAAELAAWERARDGEIGVCVLASVNVTKFVVAGPDGPRVDFAGIRATAGTLLCALDQALDQMEFGPLLAGARRSAQSHRAVAVGICGMARALQMLDVAFASQEGVALGAALHAAIYAGAAGASCDRGALLGGFPRGPEAPSAAGLIQPDLFAAAFPGISERWEARLAATAGAWGTGPDHGLGPADWDALRRRFAAGMLRNVFVTATMPCASTSVIMNTSEGADPSHNNLHTRKQHTGHSITFNPALVHKMRDDGTFGPDTMSQLADAEGSVRGFPMSPHDKAVFAAAHEIDQKFVVLHASAAQRFNTQGRSTNFFLPEPSMQELYQLHHLSHAAGCVTGSYYVYAHGADSGCGWLRESIDAAAPADPDAAPAAPTAVPTAVPTAPARAPCDPGCDSCAL